ncbi:MAG: transglycosylase SLT domain-containing protein [Terriglobales bacterium]
MVERKLLVILLPGCPLSVVSAFLHSRQLGDALRVGERPLPALGLLVLLLSLATGCSLAPGRARLSLAPPAPPPLAAVAALAAQPLPVLATPAPPPRFSGRSLRPVAVPAGDPIAALAARSENDYRAGLRLYRRGDLDAARAQFDQALDRLLMSRNALAQQPILETEYRSLLHRIHQLEMTALQAGDGFTEQTQPAPIESLARLTFPVDAATRAAVERSIRNRSGDLPLEVTTPVIQYIHYFSTPSGREYLRATYRRAGRYRAMIERTLRQVGVPEDLIYLAQAESGFNPYSTSDTGARGIWQFMPGRARDYGLKRSWWVDQRQDPAKSTLAAARFLRHLYHEFGDWYLAMAAYDAGPGTIRRAVAETGSANFWVLYQRGVLPAETRNYVPIILAMALVAKNPAQYGLQALASDPPLVDDQVTLHAPVDLRLAAECAGVPLRAMRELNPSLLRLTTPNQPDFVLHLPDHSLARFEHALDRIPPSKRVLWRYHRVRAGDTVYGLARRYHTPVRAIEAVNNLHPHAVLAAGEEVVIPTRHVQPGRVVLSKTAMHYRIRWGDSLYSLAREFGVSERDLRQWNHMRGSRLVAGHWLWVHLPVG